VREEFNFIGVREKTLPPKCWILNPIEHVWGIFTNQLYDFGHRSYSTTDELRTAAHATWKEVKVKYHDCVRKMIADLPRDLQRIIDAGGDHVKRL
jgi:hypothetical protein